MDPLSVLGAVSAASQLVEMGVKLTLFLSELYSKTQDAPAMVRKRIVQIEQLVDLSRLIVNNPSLQKKSIASALSTCLRTVQQFQEVLKKVSAAEDDGKFQKARKGFAAVVKEKEITRFISDLEREKSSLILCIQEIDSKLLYNINLKVDGIIGNLEQLAIDMPEVSGHVAMLPNIARDVHTIMQLALKRRDRRPTTREWRDTVPLQNPEPKVKSYYLVPNRRVRGFIGREDILSRIQAGFDSGVEPRVVVIRAMGGQGKTQVALEYCYRAKENPFQAIFWADATSENTIKKSFETTAERIKTPGQVLDEETSVQYLIDTLAEWPEPWLMVFDNYDDPISFNNLQEYIPEAENGYILITSRHAEIDALADPENAVELPGLSQIDARELLLKQCQIKETHENLEEATEIVDRLGYHPLAITQAGSYIKLRKLQLHEFMTNYKRQKKAILQQTPQMTAYRRKLNNAEKETSLNVFTTWELSFQQLQQRENTGSLEADILTLLAFFDSKDISEQLFELFSDSSKMPEQSSGNPGHGLRYLLDDKGKWDKDKFVEVLVDLSSMSLLQTWSRESDGFCHCSIHPLVKDWILMRIEAAPFRMYYDVAAQILSNFLALHDNYNDFSFPLEIRQSMMSHLDTHMESRDLATVVNETTQKDFLDSLHDAEFWFARLLFRGGRKAEAAVMTLRVLEYREKTLGPEHENTLDILDDRSANLSWSQQYEEAVKVDRRMVAGYTKSLGHNNIKTFISYNNLFQDLVDFGKLEEAQTVCESYLKPYRVFFGPENHETITSLNNEGWLRQQEGKIGEAGELFKQAFEANKKVFRLGHSETLVSLENYVSTLYLQGRYEEAKAMRQDLVSQKAAAWGSEHPDFLQFEASALAAQGHAEESIALCHKVIDNQILTNGLYSRETCESYYNLAGILNSIGRYEEAFESFQKCLAGETRLLEQNDPSVLKTRMSMALTKMRLGRLQEAEDDVRVIYETRLRILGPVHADTLTTLHWICIVERQQKRYENAESDFRNLIDLCTQAYGPGGHGELAISARQGLDSVLERQGKTAEREDILRDIITRQSAILGSEHEATLRNLTLLGIVLCKCSKYKDSIEVSQPLVEIQERVFGPTDEITITNLDSLGTALSHDEQFDEAEKTLRLAIERSESTKGPDHMTTLMIIKHLANALALRKPVAKYQEAAPIYGRVLTGLRSLLPADDQKIKSLELEYETMMAKQKVEVSIVQIQEI